MFAATKPIATKPTAVFLCQLLGAFHQPPVGDHTYFNSNSIKGNR
jgi:hypothetical protein